MLHFLGSPQPLAWASSTPASAPTPFTDCHLPESFIQSPGRRGRKGGQAAPLSSMWQKSSHLFLRCWHSCLFLAKLFPCHTRHLSSSKHMHARGHILPLPLLSLSLSFCKGAATLSLFLPPNARGRQTSLMPEERGRLWPPSCLPLQGRKRECGEGCSAFLPRWPAMEQLAFLSYPNVLR